jgi:hypothetical protein
MQQSSPLQTKQSDVNSEAVFLKLKTALHATEFATPNQTIRCKLRGSILETKKLLGMQQSSPTPNQTIGCKF